MKTIGEYAKEWQKAHTVEEQSEVKKALESHLKEIGIDNGVMFVNDNTTKVTISPIGVWVENVR